MYIHWVYLLSDLKETRFIKDLIYLNELMLYEHIVVSIYHFLNVLVNIESIVMKIAYYRYTRQVCHRYSDMISLY